MRSCKVPFICVISSLALSSFSQQSHAIEGLTVVTAFAYQHKELSFDQRYSGSAANANNDANFSVSLPMLNFSITGAYDKFYLSLKYEKNLSDTPTGTSESDREAFGEPNLIAVNGSDVNVGRKDTSVTLGYNLWDSLTVFVGYLNGETSLTPAPNCANPFSATTCSSTNRAFLQFFLGDNGFIDNQPTYTQQYKESGPYIGASYGLPVANYGTLSFSLAYADMDGEYRDNANDPNNVYDDPVSGAPTFLAFNYEGSTTGTSVGLTWSAPLGESSGYFLDLRRQEYSMKGRDVTNLVNFSGVSLRTDEEMTGITAGIRFYY